MFDERFARQYRYEPPTEFPLSSPYTGIVTIFRVLTDMLLLKPHSIDRSVAGANIPAVTFITLAGLPPVNSHIC